MLEIYNVHFKDLTVVEKVARVNRESHVLVGSEIARMQKLIFNSKADLEKLESEFSLGIEHSDIYFEIKITNFKVQPLSVLIGCLNMV